MVWNVLTGRSLREEALEVLDEFAEVTVADSYDNEDALIADLDRFDAIICGGITVTREWIENAPNVKLITSTGVGLDSVDIEAATEHGIPVCNNRGANTQAVAEYSISAMLAVRRGLVQADKDVRSGTWEKYGYMSSEVTGQTMGVLGYGAIGRLVIDLAQGLDMNGIAFDPYVDEEDFPEGVEPVDSVLELCERADAVGVHAPLTDETRGIVGEEELQALGSDGIIVNAARGGLIQEDALVDALRNDVIWGAGIDVFVEEPAPDDHPLFELDNVIVSPHMAGSTKISVPAKDKGGAENVRMMYNQQLPPTTVNRDELIMHRAFDAEEAPEADAF